ncbi:MAG: hypothetical protein ABSF18_03975 [Gammaproteobacteria bacterium]|jgi:hypothetical protein
MKYFLAIMTLVFGFSAVSMACPDEDGKKEKKSQHNEKQREELKSN